MKKFLVIIPLLFSMGAFSQDGVGETEIGEVTFPIPVFFGNMLVGLPFDDFKESLPNEQSIGVGIGALVLLGPNGNIGTGLSYSYLFFGKEKETVMALGEEIRLKTTNNTHLLHAMVRFSPNVTSRVQPYFDGLIGLSIFKTLTKLNTNFLDATLCAVSLALDDTEPLCVETEVFATFNDVVFSYGGALGFIIGKDWITWDVRVTYLIGGKAEYVQPGSVEYNGLNITYNTTQSKTNLLIPQFGMTIFF